MLIALIILVVTVLALQAYAKHYCTVNAEKIEASRPSVMLYNNIETTK